MLYTQILKFWFQGRKILSLTLSLPNVSYAMVNLIVNNGNIKIFTRPAAWHTRNYEHTSEFYELCDSVKQIRRAFGDN